MQVAFPFRVDARGRTAGASEDDHVRELVEQVLFTAPGERVNRPTFGSGLLELVFAPTGDALAAATEAAVRGALQEWLSDVVEVRQVTVESIDSTLSVTVEYVVRRTQQPQVASFTRSA
jgi:phage baseplate assembly protein W